MENQNTYNLTQIEDLLNDTFNAFCDKRDGVISSEEIRAVVMYIEQVKEELKKTPEIPCKS